MEKNQFTDNQQKALNTFYGNIETTLKAIRSRTGSTYGGPRLSEEQSEFALSYTKNWLDHWKDRDEYTALTEEERNDINFKTRIMETIMSEIGHEFGHIVENKEAIKEAIKYCPEGIKNWYNKGRYGILDPRNDIIDISPDVIKELANEDPEIIGRLPADIIPKEVLLEIRGEKEEKLGSLQEKNEILAKEIEGRDEEIKEIQGDQRE